MTIRKGPRPLMMTGATIRPTRSVFVGEANSSSFFKEVEENMAADLTPSVRRSSKNSVSARVMSRSEHNAAFTAKAACKAANQYVNRRCQYAGQPARMRGE